MISSGTEKQGKVSKLVKGGILILNIASMASGTRMVAVNGDVGTLLFDTKHITKFRKKIHSRSCVVGAVL